MNILSIDWDYFFPSPTKYDWSANESNPLFYEMLWSTRAQTCEAFLPSGHEEFWKNICPKEPLGICIAESHVTIVNYLAQMKNLKVWNIDAHHDCGYPAAQKGLNCGNWAFHMKKKIKEFHQVYPEWRKTEAEPEPMRKPTSISYSLLDIPQPEAIFICRSSCWTPTWADEKWMQFIGGLNTKIAWDNKKTVEYALKKRSPDMTEAKKLASEYAVLMEQLRSKTK